LSTSSSTRLVAALTNLELDDYPLVAALTNLELDD
jgi:hypothetical protein